MGFCGDDSGAGVATVVTDVVDNGGCALAGGSSVFVDMHRELTAPLNYNTMEILAAGESVTSVARVTSSSSYEALANGVGGPYGSRAVKNEWLHCNPVLNNEGLCECEINTPPAATLSRMVQHQVPPTSVATRAPHVPYLPPLSGQTHPMCRKDTLRLMYVDDVTILEKVTLPTCTVPLLPTFEPNIAMRSYQLGIPGEWLTLQHKLRDIDKSASAMGMLGRQK